MSIAPDSSPPKHSFSLVRVLMVLVPTLVLIGAVYVIKMQQWDRENRKIESTLLAQMGFESAPTPMRLDEKFTDADGDLVADPPSDPAQQITPDKLVFSFIGAPKAEQERSNWQRFGRYLSQQLGKPVEVVTFPNTDDELAAMKAGKLHIAGLNTGAVQLAVNTCGFVPVCAPGREDGSLVSSCMQIIVPADSPIHSVPDLKGHTIAFTERTSNSGYKAALVLLKDRDLLPQRDYNCRFSTAHEKSIEGIATGQYQAAAVASDMLQRAVANGDVDFTKIRVVDASKPFPPATLGYVYNLSPAMAEKIKVAILNFTWADSGLEKQFAGTGAVKFVPVSYKNDFEWARIIADAVRDPPDVAIEKDVAGDKDAQIQ